MADRRTLLRGLAALTATAIPLSATSQEARATPEPKRLATMEELAAADFAPLEMDRDFFVLTREQWSQLYEKYIVASNVAVRLLADTKPQMVDRVRQLMEEEDLSTLKLLRSVLEEGEGLLKDLQSPISSAATRLLCRACMIEVEEGGGDA